MDAWHRVGIAQCIEVPRKLAAGLDYRSPISFKCFIANIAVVNCGGMKEPE